MKKYKVCRSNIYAGKLVQPTDISVEKYEQIYNRLSKEEQEKIDKTGRNICYKENIRPILFSIDEDNLAHDLIYDIDYVYPVLNLNSKTSYKSNYIVEGIINIEILLKYLNYKEALTKQDLKRIYHQLIISSKWLEANKKLFGYVEIMPDIYINTRNGEMPQKLYDTLKKLTILSRKKPLKQELVKMKTKNHHIS